MEAKAKWTSSGVGEVDLVVIPAVAGVGEDVAASGGGGFERVGAEHPVAEVDDVDVLLHQDVSGEGAIPEPVAQAVLVGRGAGVDFFFRCGRVVVAGDGGDFAQRAGFDFFRDGGDGRRAAALEADVDALRGLDALGDFEGLLGLRNVDADRLFAVDVLAGGDGGFEMLHVEEGRRGDLDEVDVLAMRRAARRRAGRGRAACSSMGARPRLALSWLK